MANCSWLQVGGASAGAFEQGMASFEKKNYAAAQKLWQPLAKQGDVRAQYNLAILLFKGQKKQQNLKAKEYLAMSKSEGLVDGYFLTIPDVPSENNTAKTNSKAISGPLVWLNQQNKSSYTLQLATGKIRQHMEDMRKDLLSKKLKQSDNLYIHKVQSIEKQGAEQKTSVRYILIYGVFESYQQAKAEVSNLPTAIQKSSPWIRQFSVLQSIVDKEQL